MRGEKGKVHARTLRYLGQDLNSPKTLLKWWDFLGKPKIPYKSGETILDLERFLSYPTPVSQRLQQRQLIRQALLTYSKTFKIEGFQLRPSLLPS
jgi:hypothetical protein